MAGDLISNRNEILSLILAAWKDVPNHIANFPQRAEMLVTMTDGDGVPDEVGRKAWIRVNVQHVQRDQRSIAKRRFVNRGFVTIQCFIHRKVTADDDRVQRLASYFVSILSRHKGSVEFTESVAQERPIDNGFASATVTSRFQWDEFVKG